MGKNIVICCDGTGNEIEKDLSNVLKLYRIVKKTDEQIVFYDPGIGTLGIDNIWNRLSQKLRELWCLATGTGLDERVLNAYKFLIDAYEPGDRIFLFGFSRGAYTVRVLAGFIHLMGLLKPEQKNLKKYAFKAYKQASYKGDLTIAWGFREVTKALQVPMRFIGVWDTVSSVLIPRPDRHFLGIDQQRLPYTRKNPSVEIFRHAIAIDEKRRMFQINRWAAPQNFEPNPFSNTHDSPQDIKQVWFAGCHADVGGGYPETESAIAKYPLKWMLLEAKAFGLHLNMSLFNHLIFGKDDGHGKRSYTPPSPTADAHDSMSLMWRLLEWIPRQIKYRDWPKRWNLLGFYIPWCEPRFIEEGAILHSSVIERLNNKTDYKPINLPQSYEVTSDLIEQTERDEP